MKLSLGILVKEPIPGQVKTRLTPPLTADQAAELYRVALHETVERVQTADYDVVLFCSGGQIYFEKNFPKLLSIPQCEGDLGARMTAALARLHKSRPAAAALIGSDSPDLPLALIDAAFCTLKENDVVTIPASDGGYVLIGSCLLHPELFQNIDWSTDQVLTQTRQRAAAAGLVYTEYGQWEDIDDLASLQRLLERSPDSKTARYARQQLSQYMKV